MRTQKTEPPIVHTRHPRLSERSELDLQRVRRIGNTREVIGICVHPRKLNTDGSETTTSTCYFSRLNDQRRALIASSRVREIQWHLSSTSGHAEACEWSQTGLLHVDEESTHPTL